jgi:hypothetical protein
MSARPYIAYGPPKHYQNVTVKAPLRAWGAVRDLLSAWTDWSGELPGGRLDVSEGGRFAGETYDPVPLLAEALARLGPGLRHAGITRLGPDLRPVAHEHRHYWDVPSRAFDWAVELVASAPHWPNPFLGPVTFHASWRGLRLRASPGGAVLPGQDEPVVGSASVRSSVSLSLSQSPAASFHLSFPFAQPDEQFLTYLSAMRPYLPIRMAWSQFRLMLPPVRGGQPVARKISRGLFDGM